MYVKSEYKEAHHPLPILDWDYPPPSKRKGSCHSIVFIKASQVAQVWKPANTMAQNNGIINSWSLFAFAQKFGGNLAVGKCANHETGEEFPAITFTKDGKRTFVDFGKSLQGGLSLNQIIKQKDDLQIVQIEVAPDVAARRQQAGKQLETYKLCKVGESSWETVDILSMF